MRVSQAQLSDMQLLRALSKAVALAPETDLSSDMTEHIRAAKKDWWSEVRSELRYCLTPGRYYKVVLDGAEAGQLKDKRTGQVLGEQTPPAPTAPEIWVVTNAALRTSRTFACEPDARAAAGYGDIVTTQVHP